MILAEDDPLRILYRSEVPVLEPEKETERFGVVDNVVFPTPSTTYQESSSRGNWPPRWGWHPDRAEKQTLPYPLREVLYDARFALSSVNRSGRVFHSSCGPTPKAFASFLRTCMDG